MIPFDFQDLVVRRLVTSWSLGTFSLAKAKHHVRSPTTLRMPCCEETQDSHVKRPLEREMSASHYSLALDMWVKKSSDGSSLNCIQLPSKWDLPCLDYQSPEKGDILINGYLKPLNLDTKQNQYLWNVRIIINILLLLNVLKSGELLE